MILKLTKGEIHIVPMCVPESQEHALIEYIYETNTNHLTPMLYIDGKLFTGDHIKINLSDFKNPELDVQIDLVDHFGTPIKKYRSKIPKHNYVLLGTKPMRPDMEDYIKILEARIRELEEQGEVI